MNLNANAYTLQTNTVCKKGAVVSKLFFDLSHFILQVGLFSIVKLLSN